MTGGASKIRADKCAAVESSAHFIFVSDYARLINGIALSEPTNFSTAHANDEGSLLTSKIVWIN